MKMNNLSAVLFLSMIFAAAYAALPSSEEVMDQLLILAVKQLEANQQGMVSTLPWLTYHHSLYNSGETLSMQRERSKEMLRNTGKAKSSTFSLQDEAELQGKQFVPKILIQFLKYMAHSTKDYPSASRITITTEQSEESKYRERLHGYFAQNSLQSRLVPVKDSTLRRRALECTIKTGQEIIDVLRETKYGAHEPETELFRNILSNFSLLNVTSHSLTNAFKNALKFIITRLSRYAEDGSEELIGKTGSISSQIFSHAYA